MTGFGEAHASEDGVGYSLEIKSLNNRYFKATIRLPESLQFMEADVEKMLRDRVQRGSIAFSLRVRNSGLIGAYEIDRVALLHYVEQVREVLPAGDASGAVDLGALLSLPGVCQVPELSDEARQQYVAVIKKLTSAAMDMLVEMRRREGEALRLDLVGHCDQIRRLGDEIAGRAPTVIQEYQQRLRERVSSLLADAKLDLEQDAVLREVALFADRCDISEELSRLVSHLDQFVRLCESPEHAGRKMDFLTQEMLREANTIGSKSNDSAIAHDVVEIKGCIDRLKEQVQNVE